MYKIEAEIYTTADQFEYVKVNIDGVYISGIKVMDSIKHPGTLWIQMPSYKVKTKWRRYIESAKDSPLGAAMYKAIEDVVNAKLHPNGGASSNAPKESFVVTDKDLENEINLDDIPF
jgi:DNA-binding cell septation regulator SpoVG